MSDIKTQIKLYSSQAVEFSKQAAVASKERDFSKNKALMRQANPSQSKLSEFNSTILTTVLSHRVKAERGESLTHD